MENFNKQFLGGKKKDLLKKLASLAIPCFKQDFAKQR
jgi:hypothetical protein